MALGALKGETLCKNVGINPTRTGILRAFDKLGVSYKLLNKRVSGGEETADILVKKTNMRAISLTAEDIPSMIDELPLIALLCAFADGESRITGAKELRVKESDRIKTTVSALSAFGGRLEETEDGIEIYGTGNIKGGRAKGYNDHRIVMALAIASTIAEEKCIIEGAEAVKKSYPKFFEDFGELGGEINVV